MLRLSSTSGITKPWLIATVLWFISVCAFTWLNFQNGTQHTICPLKNLTSLPCPGCGGTRASIALSKGHISEAFSYNPLTASILLLSPLILFGLVKNQKRDPSKRWYPGRIFWTIAIGVVLANWWFVIRNLP